MLNFKYLNSLIKAVLKVRFVRMIQLPKIKYACNYPGKLSSLFFSPVGSTGSRNGVDSNNKAARKERMQLNTFFHNKNSVVNGCCCFSNQS